jgi:DNA-binding response OmpR family regulator
MVLNPLMTAAKDARNDSSSRLLGMRVLVVEDGWQVADALKLALERVGMIVVGPAASPGEARSLADECRLDLAIVDVNLRGQMAYDLMDWLHQRGTPVIVISGYEDLPRSLQKFAAILHKPFTLATLLTTLYCVMQGN